MYANLQWKPCATCSRVVQAALHDPLVDGLTGRRCNSNSLPEDLGPAVHRPHG
jgi:hypothetical protein